VQETENSRKSPFLHDLNIIEQAKDSIQELAATFLQLVQIKHPF